MALYFQRHDGQAVTCDDFAQAMADANPSSALTPQLSAFKRWYAQAGTPRLSARACWDGAAGTLSLTLSQSCPATPGQSDKLAFVIPVRMGLVAPDGRAPPPPLQGREGSAEEQFLVLEQAQQTGTVTGLPGLGAASGPPLPSPDVPPRVLRHGSRE